MNNTLAPPLPSRLLCSHPDYCSGKPLVVARSRCRQSRTLQLSVDTAGFPSLHPDARLKLGPDPDPGNLPGFDEVSRYTHTPEIYAFASEIVVRTEEMLHSSP